MAGRLHGCPNHHANREAVSIRHTFEVRRLEVFFAASTFGMGVFLAAPMKSMGGPAYDVLRVAAQEWLWAWLFMTNGLSHCLWLAVNGARWWSPIARWFAAGFSVLLYLFWALAFAAVNASSTAVFTYGAMAAGSALCCVWAWRDALIAVRLAHDVRTS